VLAGDAVKRFELVRHEDITGVTGTGVVAEGVQWSNGQVTVCWRGEHSSIVIWPSMEDAMAIHGYDGATEAVWRD
jgi:hypothetical protein